MVESELVAIEIARVIYVFFEFVLVESFEIVVLEEL